MNKWELLKVVQVIEELQGYVLPQRVKWFSGWGFPLQRRSTTWPPGSYYFTARWRRAPKKPGGRGGTGGELKIKAECFFFSSRLLSSSSTLRLSRKEQVSLVCWQDWAHHPLHFIRFEDNYNAWIILYEGLGGFWGISVMVKSPTGQRFLNGN